MGDAPLRVLIVDDEVDITKSLGDLLRSHMVDVEVLGARDGVEGLEVLEVVRPDLIITDYVMPRMDGLEFLKRARDRYPDVPRLLMTAYPDPQLAALAVVQAGVGLFIAKPFDPAYLVDVLARLLSADKPDA